MVEWFWWPLVAVILSFASSGTIYLVGSWASRDRAAIALHEALTTGDVATARQNLSKHEYRWWTTASSGGHTFKSTGAIDEHIFSSFYVVGGALDRLRVILVQYPSGGPSQKRPGQKRQLTHRTRRWLRHPLRQRRDRHYRELLGWHASMFIAWQIWFIGMSQAGAGQEETPPLLTGSIDRLGVAIRQIGSHVIKTDGDTVTILDLAETELTRWLNSVHTQNSRESKVIRNVATTIGLSIPDNPNETI
ncbi:hypothetical protein R4P64_31925 [Rhodococcus sp. IEGM 1366]|uniref:hypothetical protein n=1 Tax=Rhodococcus sp. IEGM 1366 TaxID=3082223 RepID=UPI00295380A8|nr:hypothetical protein [Rhodococcus sp. IEGM 1366]MDV8071130.1 hypothetical protein [Rhodococcus sp. IEGM 1366]